MTESPPVDEEANRYSTASSDSDEVATTRSGRHVTKPARYCDSDSYPEGSASQWGEVVRHMIRTVEEWHVIRHVGH